jgi:selenoprotein W-related protein
LNGWAPVIADISLLPSSNGRFEVTLDDELIYSKLSTGRHAADGEIAAMVRERIGPEIPRG